MMKQINTRTMIRTALAAMVLVAAVPVLGQVEFTFEGFSKSTLGQDTVGSSYTVLGIANPPVSAPTPLPMDFASNQYTIRVVNMALTAFTFTPGLSMKEYVFNGAVIEIYEDAIAGGTAANYANEATFTDGVMLLQAAVDPNWDMLLDNPIGFGFSGAGIGTCVLNGGSELAYLLGLEFPMGGWTFAGTGIAEPSFFVSVPAGFDLVFGIKIIFPFDPTGNDDASWGDLKTMFR